MKKQIAERDKFLTEAMGECWHEPHASLKCPKCKKNIAVETNRPYGNHFIALNNDFSTWSNFGKLWEWAIKQEWWPDFIDTLGCLVSDDCSYCSPRETLSLINPDRFADIICKYLKEK